ncbi:hypothetical protein ACWDBD_21765 [Streptomyces sp. NPDC001118]
MVDIDGTVAKHVLSNGTLLRGHHDYRLVVRDLPNPPVIDTVNALRPGVGWVSTWGSGLTMLCC